MSDGLSALKVLLVDDNHHMRAIVTTILRAAGVLHVREAADGAEAFTALREWPADLAIIDYQMAPMDGVAFTRLVRQDPASPNPFLPIIMMTGFAERRAVVSARDTGVTEFIVKPVTVRAVLDRLNAVIFRTRPFVRSPTYFGPTRRRVEALPGGPRRRLDDRCDPVEI